MKVKMLLNFVRILRQAQDEREKEFALSSVRPDASTGSAVNATLNTSRDCSNPVRPELVEGYEQVLFLLHGIGYVFA